MLAVVLTPGSLLAQSIGLPRSSVGGSLGADVSDIALETYAPAELGTLSATGWDASDRAAVGGEASAARFASGHTLFYGAGHAALDLVRGLSSRLTVQADGGGGSYRGQASAGYGQASLALTQNSPAAGRTWVSAAAGRAWSEGAYATAHVAVGATLERGPIAWSANAKVVHARANYADVNADVIWRVPLARDAADLRTVLLGVDVGARGGRRDPYPRWASVNATITPRSRVQLVASYGVFPSDAEHATIHARALTVGAHIMLHRATAEATALNSLPRSSSVRVVRTGTSDKHAVFVRVPNAATVELMGDFTQWAPAALRRVNDSEWRGDFTIPAGAHRIDIRVNGGAWQPLAGVPQVADDFGGSSSLLVVP